jgi:thiosulfate/3-mercaptopyruvate sulfurtransferase
MPFLRRFIYALIFSLLASIAASGADTAPHWTTADLISASDLSHQLGEVNSGKITLIQVGFGVMYRMGHIPGSQYAGPASQPDGLASLKKLVANLPRARQIVIYCGCCPWDHCPNIRPAYAALRGMGFTNIKLLEIPQRFYDDWTAKGLPTAKGE